MSFSSRMALPCIVWMSSCSSITRPGGGLCSSMVSKGAIISVEAACAAHG